jgi:hypothetical protein
MSNLRSRAKRRGDLDEFCFPARDVVRRVRVVLDFLRVVRFVDRNPLPLREVEEDFLLVTEVPSAKRDYSMGGYPPLHLYSVA